MKGRANPDVRDGELKERRAGLVLGMRRAGDCVYPPRRSSGSGAPVLAVGERPPRLRWFDEGDQNMFPEAPEGLAAANEMLPGRPK